MQIFTERLYIHTLRCSQWQDVQEICADFERSAYAQYDYPLPIEEKTVQQLTERWAQTGQFYSVHIKGCEEAIGFVCFHGDDALDVGFNFKARYQGKGYAYEAVSAMLEEMNKTRRVTRFTAGLALDNLPSRRLIEKLGFSLVSRERRSFRTDDNGVQMQHECGNFEKNMP